MSLQVWLPLTKDLRQQGLDNITVTTANTNNFQNEGKLSSKSLDVSGHYAFRVPSLVKKRVFSCAFWYKPITDSSLSDNWRRIIVFDTYTSDGSTTGAIFRFESSYGYQSSNTTYCISIHNNAGEPIASIGTGLGETNGWNKWQHIAITADGTTLKCYRNGVQVASGNMGNGGMLQGTVHIGYNGNRPVGRLNDFRLYDHCLSPMEVKELAKGLVLHYPLNRQGLGPSNLIKNGFGELGTKNWTNSSNISTTDIPSGQSDIKISVTNNYTVERIKIYPTHTYKFSAWIKATTTSGNTYPSLFPYDVDGKFIDYYKCSDSFNLNTMTTLKQQLKTGDTKIYVNDLSQWNANSGHYYNWAAIFSYTDSTGYTYPDGTYTQNLGRFGSSTNAKTNLDKTNNIITLTTAYTGPNMPVGTKLCASTEGGTYYYPLGGISLANIQDWTYKEGTFSASTARLKYAKEVMFYTYSNNRMAGIKLQDLTNESLNGTTEYDCSGFCNNGTRTGTFTWTSDTPKYQVSTKFTGTQFITADSPTSEGATLVLWAKTTSTSNAAIAVDYKSKLGFGFYSGVIIPSCNGNIKTTYATTNYTINQWNHIVVVRNSSSTLQLYINGVLQTNTTSTQDYWSGGVIDGLSIAARPNGSSPVSCQVSDVRIYATALSADDVKSLYQNNAYIDSSGNVYGVVYNEV